MQKKMSKLFADVKVYWGLVFVATLCSIRLFVLYTQHLYYFTLTALVLMR